MGLYSKYILPKATDWVCRQKPSRMQREKIIPLAIGNVLEIGIGSGLNLPYYEKDNIQSLTGIEPSKEIWNRRVVDTHQLPFEFNIINAFAENLPLDSNSFDTVVLTYTMCTIPDTQKAFEEIRRVLKMNGNLIFCEHGKAPDRAVQKWQNRINPLWKKVAGGCHLNKDIPLLIEDNGFKFNTLEAMYIPGWKPASFNYWGSAKIK